jgi:hypothetical protein
LLLLLLLLNLCLAQVDEDQTASSSSSSSCPSPQSARGGGRNMIAKPEMCYFCFDVLYSHLYHLDPPRVPAFTNDY